MTTIGVISDTHLRAGGKRQLPPQVFETFKGVSLILHLGDLNTLQVVAALEAIAPVIAVHGNNDDREAMQVLPTTRRVEIEQAVLGLAHGDRGVDTFVKALSDVPGNRQTAANALSHFEFEEDVSCVVFGHSHLPLIKWHECRGRRVLLLNPGSPTDKRWGPHYGCGLLRVEGRSLEAELTTW